MVRCVKCGMDNPDRSVFCVKCGVLLEKPKPELETGPEKAEPDVDREMPKPEEPLTVEAPYRKRDRLIVSTVIGVIAMLIFMVLLVALVGPTSKGITATELFAQYDNSTSDFSSYYKDGDTVTVTDVVEDATLIPPSYWENISSYYSSYYGTSLSMPSGYSTSLRLHSLENTMYSTVRVVVEGDLTGEVGKEVTITLHMEGFELFSQYSSYYENRSYVFPVEILWGSLSYMYGYSLYSSEQGASAYPALSATAWAYDNEIKIYVYSGSVTAGAWQYSVSTTYGSYTWVDGTVELKASYVSLGTYTTDNYYVSLKHKTSGHIYFSNLTVSI